MNAELGYIIRYVGDMNTAVRFRQEQLGLPLRFESPHWSEFDTGAATLALQSHLTNTRPVPARSGSAWRMSTLSMRKNPAREMSSELRLHACMGTISPFSGTPMEPNAVSESLKMPDEPANDTDAKR